VSLKTFENILETGNTQAKVETKFGVLNLECTNRNESNPICGLGMTYLDFGYFRILSIIFLTLFKFEVRVPTLLYVEHREAKHLSK